MGPDERQVQKAARKGEMRYKIFGDRKDVYSNILIYPVADSEMFAIEIVIDFPFTDFPESIIDDHWWDDSLLAKLGLIK